MVDNKLFIPLIFGLFGFIFTTKIWILFVDQLDPILGLLVYYIVLGFIIVIVQYLGFKISNISPDYSILNYTIGILLIIFSFNLVTSWESCYINEVARGDCNVSSIYLHSEDGAVYHLFSYFIENQNIKRILTYVILPVILSYIGIYLITLEVKNN